MREFILIVDDDMDDVLLLKTGLERVQSKYEIRTAWSGTEVLKMLAEFQPDGMPRAIILDFNMPILNGLDTLKKLNVIPKFRSIKKVVRSTFQASETIEKCLQNGAEAYFTKPVSIPEMVAVVKEILLICGN